MSGAGVTPAKVEPAVTDPAFSLTKVLTLGASILTPLLALLVKELGDESSINYEAAHVVALTLGVLGLLTIVSAADIIGRSIAAGAEANKTAATIRRDSENLITFDKPLPATYQDAGATVATQNVTVLAAAGGATAYFLVRTTDGGLRWMTTDAVDVAPAAP